MPETMTQYVTRSAYTSQKARLTRAKNSGDPLLILTAVERTLEEWHGKAWPDDWARFAVALDDAYYSFIRSEAGDDDRDLNDEKIARRFRAASDLIH